MSRTTLGLPIRRLESWLIARVAVATLLLGGTLLLTSSDPQSFERFTQRLLIGLIVTTYASSALAGAASVGRVFGRGAGAILVALDLVTINVLLWSTGGALSVFTVLLAVNVVVAALVLGATAAWLASFASLMAYVTLAVSSANGWLPPPPDQLASPTPLSDPELGVALLSNIAGLLLIPGLASLLASRLSQAGGQLREATESAQELARLNDDIVRSIASGLITLDREGHIRTVNPAGAEILGASPSALLGEPIQRFFSTLDVHTPMPAGHRAEGLGRRFDGEPFPVGFGTTALLDAQGATLGTLLTFQDLTEIQRLRETALREERLAALGRLSTGLAHEIRNPLSSISGSVELVLESGTVHGEDAMLLRMVTDEVDRLNELVTTMLAFSHGRALARGPTDLGALVTDVATMARTSPAAREIDIHVEVTNDAIAEVDADQMRQVVWNLLKNALQVSAAGSAVHLRVALEPPASCTIEVRDEGPGLGEAPNDRLFDAFFTTRAHGIGLGLALVRQIVEHHRGEVKAWNHPEGGAVFHVRLPLASGTKSGEISL